MSSPRRPGTRESWHAKDFAAMRDDVAARAAASGQALPHALLALFGAPVPDGLPWDPLAWQATVGIRMLEAHADAPFLSAAQAKTVAGTVTAILNGSGVTRGASRLSFLHAQLLAAQGRAALGEGAVIRGAWEQAKAWQALHRPDPGTAAPFRLAYAAGLLRAGLASACLSVLESVPAAGDDATAAPSTLLRARALRLAGDAAAARHALAAVADDGNDAGLAWEKAWAHADPPCLPSLPAATLTRLKASPENILLLKLHAYAGPYPRGANAFPKAESLKRRASVDAAWRQRHAALLDAVAALDHAHDDAVPLPLRLDALDETLAARGRLACVEHEALWLAAMARFLDRHSLAEAAVLPRGLYEALSLALSNGASRDVLALNAHLPARPAARASSSWPRPARALLAAGKAGWRSVTRKQPTGGEEAARVRSNAWQAFGQEFFREMESFRGGLTKVGQTLAHAAAYEPDLRWAAALTHETAPATPFAAVRAVVESSLGRSLADAFAHFSPEPLGVGSIGQVHRALTTDGRDVAVKVRHPGIAETLDRDLASLRFFLPLIRRMLPKADVDALWAEVCLILRQEVDFAREARHQRDFAALFAGDADILIPAVHADLSTGEVLTMDHVAGESYYAFLACASDEERRRHAATIIRFHAQAFAHGLFQGDPFPGNHVAMADGRVAFFDFGCVKRWEPAFIDHWLAMARSVMENDRHANRAAWQALGYDTRAEGLDWDWQFEVAGVMFAPLAKPGVFRFTPAWLEALGRLHVSAGNRNMSQLSPPPEAAFLLRVVWGLLPVLVELGAEGDWHAPVAAFLARRDGGVAGHRAGA